MHWRRLTATLLTALVVGLTVAGCGGDPSETLGAAEPAKAPEPTVAPAGMVQDLAPQPEGMTYDAVTDILAVAVREPNRLLLIQGATGQLLQSVPLPGHARHLQLAGPGGPVLVPAEDSNMLVTVELPEGQASAVQVGNYPHDAASTASGRIVVADERGGTVSVVAGGEVVHTFTDPTQPAGVAAVGDEVGLVDVGAFTLSVYDAVQERRLAVLPAGAGPTHLVADRRGDLIVADTRGDALLFFSLDPLTQRGRVPLSGTPYGMAYDPQRDRVWVTLTARNEVVGLDVSDNPSGGSAGSAGAAREVARFPTVRQPNTVAVDPETGRVWVSSRTTGQLQTIDP